MDKGDAHEPQLPGVRTYSKDKADAETEQTTVEGVTFNEKAPDPDDNEVHTPEAPVKTQAELQKKSSILTDSDNVFDVSNAFKGGDGGTILTDKRVRGSKLGRVVSGAFKEWLGDTKQKIEKIEFLQEEEAPTVEAVEERKGVVEEAGKYSKQAPRDDHTIVVEKLKTMKADAERVTGKPFILKSKAEVKPEAGKWTHVTEDTPKVPEPVAPTVTPPSDLRKERTEKPDLRKSAIAPKVTERAETSPEQYPTAQKPETQKPEPSESATPDRAAAPKPDQPPAPPKPSPEPPEERGWSLFKKSAADSKPSSSTPEVVEDSPARSAPQETPPFPRPAPAKPENVSLGADLGASKREALAPQQAAPGRIGESALSHSRAAAESPEGRFAPKPAQPDTNKLRTVLLTIVIVVIGIAAAASIAVYFVTRSSAPEQTPSTVATTPSILHTDAQTPITLEGGRDAFLGSLTEQIGSTSGGVQLVYPVFAGVSEPATAQEIFSVLQPTVGGAFIRALRPEMALGSVRTDSNQPFLVIQSNNFDALFAGMLEWESHIITDLAPLFGEVVTESLDPGTGEIRDATFVDATRNNRSIRILYDSRGNERILYAFVNRSTVIVTTSTDALSALLSRI